MRSVAPHPSFRNLSADDLMRGTALCERTHRLDTKESFANHALAVLDHAVERTHFCFMHFRTDPLELAEARSETISPEIFAAFESRMHQHPLLQRLIRSGESQTRTLQCAMAGTDFHKTGLYNEILAPLGVKDQLTMNIRHEQDLFLISYDRDRAYGENEQAMMMMFQPHVRMAWSNWHRMRGLEQQLQMLEEKNTVSEASAKQAAAARKLMDGLTPRQRNIAELVARGLENRAIAEALYIAPKTVGKHLENIFQTLEIHHRATLATRWQQAKSP